MQARETRREFLQRVATSGGALTLLASGLSARSYAANEKLGMALVGLGGRGDWFVKTMPKLASVLRQLECGEIEQAT